MCMAQSWRHTASETRKDRHVNSYVAIYNYVKVKYNRNMDLTCEIYLHVRSKVVLQTFLVALRHNVNHDSNRTKGKSSSEITVSTLRFCSHDTGKLTSIHEFIHFSLITARQKGKKRNLAVIFQAKRVQADATAYMWLPLTRYLADGKLSCFLSIFLAYIMIYDWYFNNSKLHGI